MDYTELPDDPRAVGVPHAEWFNYQRQAIDFISKSKKKFCLVEGHTGVGKSAVVSAQAHFNEKVTVLTATHSLTDQYEGVYSFSAIRGKDNYSCAEQSLGISCDYCLYSPMGKCPSIDCCEYHITKLRALSARRTVSNYHYAWYSSSIQKRSDFLACDEAHLIENTVLSIVGVELKIGHLRRFWLPDFPVVMKSTVNVESPFFSGVMQWLDECIEILEPIAKEPKDGNPVLPEERAAFYRLRDLKALYTGLESGEEWFVNSGPQVHPNPIGIGYTPGFVCKPLDPGRFAPGLFSGFDKVLLISATLGDPEVLAETLGLPDGQWESSHFADPQFIQKNPVYVVPSPEMTAKAGEKEYEAQADTIAWVVGQQSKEDRGIVFTTSWYRVEQMAKALGRRGLSDRIYVPNKGKTGQQVDGFLNGGPGTIAIVPIFSWGHGLDLTPDKCNFSILAKTPWMDWGDPYVQARAKRKGGRKWYDTWAAILGTQALFRVRSGNRYIVDGSWKRVHKYAPRWLRAEEV